jgi:hypothetical protein
MKKVTVIKMVKAEHDTAIELIQEGRLGDAARLLVVMNTLNSIPGARESIARFLSERD